MALQTQRTKNNLNEMRKTVALKFPNITSLHSGNSLSRPNLSSKENRPPIAGSRSGNGLELVAMEPPKTYEFGARSSNTIYMPQGLTNSNTTTSNFPRQTISVADSRQPIITESPKSTITWGGSSRPVLQESIATNTISSNSKSVTNRLSFPSSSDYPTSPSTTSSSRLVKVASSNLSKDPSTATSLSSGRNLTSVHDEALIEDYKFLEEYAVLNDLETEEANIRARSPVAPTKKSEVSPVAFDQDDDASLEELEVMLQTAMDEKRRLGDLIMDLEDLDQDTDELKKSWRAMRDRINNLQPKLEAKKKATTSAGNSSARGNIDRSPLDDALNQNTNNMAQATPVSASIKAFSNNCSADYQEYGAANQSSIRHGYTTFENNGNIGSSSNASNTFFTSASSVTTTRSHFSPALESDYRKSQSPTTKESMLYPWSRRVMAALRDIFGLQDFRMNQLAAINATLSGKDVFVLMPTGGGKSLCYQLPATVGNGSGNTPTGVTIVISPLLSLMQDQAMHLVKKGIPTVLLHGNLDAAMRKFVFDQLHAEQVIPKLVYMTPEMLSKSGQAQSTLRRLHSRKLLARFVIDEAHCLSQWGHDFRPDYKLLSQLKSTYPGVPLMALTATANAKVQQDVLFNLGMQNCLVLKQSFNRRNLYYEVRAKTGQIYADIHAFITATFPGSSGIIYCTSKRACEEIADKLRNEYGLSAQHYHAGLDKSDRIAIQKSWQDGGTQIIVATVAFGMGIDKANVRFVIHHSLPQSLEGYYQETGRAGRDGNNAHCILFYTYRDKATIEFMIDKGEGNHEQKQRQRDNLKQMIMYCENKMDCRRAQVLSYFGEHFSPLDCANTCDNCRRGQKFDIKDVSTEAKTFINFVRQIVYNEDPSTRMSLHNYTARQEADRFTLLYLVDLFRGAKIKKIIEVYHHDQLQGYGIGKTWDRTDAERLARLLVSKKVLDERVEASGQAFASYVYLGREACGVMNGSVKIEMPFASGNTKSSLASAISSRKRSKKADADGSSNTSTTKAKAKASGNKGRKKTKQGGQEIDDGFEDLIEDEVILLDDYSPDPIEDAPNDDMEILDSRTELSRFTADTTGKGKAKSLETSTEAFPTRYKAVPATSVRSGGVSGVGAGTGVGEGEISDDDRFYDAHDFYDSDGLGPPQANRKRPRF
ncbi:hypothetical protein BCR41DRAFT_426086 [Lobosporangium transversale]|uniref:DNA 3'-5' helicase n=1 Tax=Lobosporangium transversale TaxID=64571 RepID=A0A1Y2GA19_9FUNG|nr:hypothetical protein BCR41DRAFT_426086 [Lobosporangium transversale]ORZ04057.1 hypothetical protein BCR41DRAFT_426086 [Lobosporangium transversale]|eukprot:XP_021876334.1 hypothetical protein BCR41DRAFT_426086 [Lobosporangium transversale]